MDQLIAEAYSGNLHSEKVLYIKEAIKLRALGFSVERMFSTEFDHPKRNSFLYKISWNNVSDESSLAQSLYFIATESIAN